MTSMHRKRFTGSLENYICALCTHQKTSQGGVCLSSPLGSLKTDVLEKWSALNSNVGFSCETHRSLRHSILIFGSTFLVRMTHIFTATRKTNSVNGQTFSSHSLQSDLPNRLISCHFSLALCGLAYGCSQKLSQIEVKSSSSQNFARA
jgi:hypothetical protein